MNIKTRVKKLERRKPSTYKNPSIICFIHGEYRAESRTGSILSSKEIESFKKSHDVIFSIIYGDRRGNEE